MNRRRNTWCCNSTAAALVLAVSTAMASTPRPDFPDFKQVVHVVRQQFATVRPTWRPIELITQSQVRAALDTLAARGWKVSDRDAILKSVIADGDSLAVQLNTPAGRKFSERIASLPGGYDRVDRLRKIPRGERFLKDMIAGPDGDKLIEYFTTTPGGAEMGRMLGSVPGGARFNQPTGMIYTERQFIARLAESYQRDLAERQSTDASSGR
ncbi:MAG: hypothetical protein K1X74_12040 [Pirellulales bacterium]|nr:hypothetical protein [Pirellulales bacterium]